MEHVEVEGLRIGYRRRGAGPPLLLLHGGVCDSRVWRVQLDELSDAFTVVAWDAPGCGGSDDPPESFGLPDYADCLAGLVDALGLRRPHLVGHSWGAGLAIEVCRRHPAVPASLVLIGGYAGWGGSLPADDVERRLAFALDVADRLPDWDPTTMPGLFSPALPTDRRGELVAIMRDIRRVGTRVMARAFADADLRDALGHIAVPTLVLHGERDERAPREVADALHRAIPGATLTVLAGLGHESYLESPAAVDTAIRDFLAAVP